MYKIWIDTDTGEWGWMNNIRSLDVQWWDEFEELIKGLSAKEVARLGKVLGKDIK